MRRAVARWVQRRIAVRRDQQVLPPGAFLATRVREADTTEHVIISYGDKLELISGTDRMGYSVSTISPEGALKLAWFILWTFWLRGTWLGTKLSAWSWTLEVEIEEAKLERSAKIQRAKRAAFDRGQ